MVYWSEKYPAKMNDVPSFEWHVPKNGFFVVDTPCKINMEPTSHPFRKENDLPNLHDYVPC